MAGFARRWWPVALLALLLLVLQWRFWFGAGGWSDAGELQEAVSAQRAENARLQQRNDALSAEVEDLKSGESAVEERARSELGMIKPGETFYRVVEPHATPGGAPPPPTPNPATAQPAEGALDAQAVDEAPVPAPAAASATDAPALPADPAPPAEPTP